MGLNKREKEKLKNVQSNVIWNFLRVGAAKTSELSYYIKLA